MVLALAIGACGGSSSETSAPVEELKPETFPKIPVIDNRYVTLSPGTQFVLEGTANRGPGVLPHRITVTVTDLTKQIAGVTTRVVHEVDTNEGTVQESELAFHAQDQNGDVWNLGEYPEEYEGGRLVGAPSLWIAGQGKAKAGIHIRKAPATGTAEYQQGYVPDIEFGDVAKVVKTGQRVCVKMGCFDDAIVIDEWNTFEPKPHQLKTYAPGMATILVEPVNDPESERLELVAVNRLTAEELAKAREEALVLDRRAYEKDGPYKATSPAVPG